MVVDWMMLKHDRQIARVLRDFAAPEFAFFLQLLEVREHYGHQLQDDRRGDVRHDAQRENRQPAQVAAAEQVENAQERARSLLENGFQHAPVDARRGNVRTDAIHRQQRQRKQHPVPQIWDAEEVLECFEESIHALTLLLLRACASNLSRNRRVQKLYATTSNVPPALVIFSFADALKACA